MAKTNSKVRLSNHLYRLRKSRRLRQKAVALLVGHADARFLSHYENGTKLPPLRTALALQVILGAELSEIYLPLYRAIERDVLSRTVWLPDAIARPIRSRLRRKDHIHADT